MDEKDRSEATVREIIEEAGAIASAEKIARNSRLMGIVLAGLIVAAVIFFLIVYSRG